MTKRYIVRPNDDIGNLRMVGIDPLNALRRANIHTIADVLGYSEHELLDLNGISHLHLASIKQSLAELGYSLRKSV